MVPLLSLTARRNRLGVLTLIMITNQRLEVRSQTTRGSDVPEALRTEVQDVLVVVFSAPSAPVLSKTLTRPFRHMSTCVGLTSPIVSGGMNPESLSTAPKKLRVTGCGLRCPYPPPTGSGATCG